MRTKEEVEARLQYKLEELDIAGPNHEDAHQIGVEISELRWVLGLDQ